MRCRRKTLHMKVDYNPYEGREVTGVDRHGHLPRPVVIDGGKFVGTGRRSDSFIKRATMA